MKKIIALLSAMTMMASTAVMANAEVDKPTLKVVYNTVESTDTNAVLDIYAEVPDMSAGFRKISLIANIAEGVINTSATGTVNGTVLAPGGVGCTYIPKTRQLGLTAQDVNGGVTIPADGKIGTITIPLASPVTSKGAFVVKSAPTSFTDDNGTKLACDFISDNVLPIASSEKVAESTDLEGDPAVAYKATATVNSGDTPYWYGTLADASKKVAAEVPNVDGEVTMGLIFTGTESLANVKLVVE